MKMYNKLLALCVFHADVWGASSFLVPTSKSHASLALHSSVDTRTRYNGGYSVSEDAVFSDPQQFRDAPNAPLAPYDRAPLTRYSPSQGGGRPAQPQRWRRPHQEEGVVQGGSRRSWSSWDHPYGRHERMHVNLQTEGRPLEANVEMWQGPNNVPASMRVYSEDGRLRPFNAYFETRGSSATMDIRNAGPLEYPLSAGVQGTNQGRPMNSVKYTTVQGGSLRTFAFGPSVESVQVDLHSDGMPMTAIVELWQGPNNVKQIAEIYTDDGRSRPFTAVIDTPGYGNTIAIRNAGPMEYPLKASLDPLYY